MTIEYLQDPEQPTTEELLASPIFNRLNFNDQSITTLPYREIFGLLYRSEYGQKLAELDLRYSSGLGYEPRELMAYEYGLDAQPVAHNFTTFAHIRNAIGLEESRGVLRLSPYQKDVALFSGGVHDGVEGIVGDMPRGTKTPEFRAWEDSERWIMLTSVYKGILPVDFLHEADDVIGHRNTGLEHDFYELGHTVTQFKAGMRAARICFQLMNSGGFHITPWPNVKGDAQRKTSMLKMASEVTKNTSNDLRHFSEKGFWLAGEALQHNQLLLERIQEELTPLADA